MAVPPDDGKPEALPVGGFPAATRIGSVRQQAQSRASNRSVPGKGKVLSHRSCAARSPQPHGGVAPDDRRPLHWNGGCPIIDLPPAAVSPGTGGDRDGHIDNTSARACGRTSAGSGG